MIAMELTSPESYTGNDIQIWAEINEATNEIASRIVKKYFNKKNTPKTIRRSFYFVNVTPNGGVLLKRDLSKSPKS